MVLASAQFRRGTTRQQKNVESLQLPLAFLPKAGKPLPQFGQFIRVNRRSPPQSFSNDRLKAVARFRVQCGRLACLQRHIQLHRITPNARIEGCNLRSQPLKPSLPLFESAQHLALAIMQESRIRNSYAKSLQTGRRYLWQTKQSLSQQRPVAEITVQPSKCVEARSKMLAAAPKVKSI